MTTDKEPKPYPEAKGLVSKKPDKPPPRKDQDGSTEAKAIESHKGPVCPSCKEVVFRGQLGAHGLATCNHCKKQFRWQKPKGGPGALYRTWVKEEGKAAPEKPPEMKPPVTSGIIGPSTSK